MMWADKIENGIFQAEVPSQAIVLLGIGQSLTHQTAIALPRGQVVTFDIGGVDLLAAQNFSDDFARTEDDPPPDLDDAPLRAMFFHLGIEQLRVQHPRRLSAGPTRPTFGRWRFGAGVVSDECCDIGWQFVTREQ